MSIWLISRQTVKNGRLSREVKNRPYVYDTQGKIYDAMTYGSDGMKIARIDFQGSAHFIPGFGYTLPHVHTFLYYNGFTNAGLILPLFPW